MQHADTTKEWLIWDGECAFCGRAMSWFEALDVHGRFMIWPSQSCPSPPMTPALRDVAAQSVIVITSGGRMITGGRAITYALERIGWHPMLMRMLARRPWIWAIDAGYRIVANHRGLFARILFRHQPRHANTPSSNNASAKDDHGGVS